MRSALVAQTTGKNVSPPVYQNSIKTMWTQAQRSRKSSGDNQSYLISLYIFIVFFGTAGNSDVLETSLTF